MELGSGSSSGNSSSSDPLNGLKFGQKIYFEDAGVGAPATGNGTLSPAPSPAPSKRGRSVSVPPRCKVEGCKADLSDAKGYYSKHKVCGVHSKSPTVIVAGVEQRFCQQCSRFHQLPEFDQGKRSCRRRLAGHNERRRKPPSVSLFSIRYGHLSSSMFENNSRSGSFLVDFSAYPDLTGSSWPNIRASHEQGWNNQSAASGKFLQRPWLNNSENSSSDPVLQNAAIRTTYPGPCIPSGYSFHGVSDSNGALSLLSNPSWGSRGPPSSLGLNSLVNTDGGHTIRPSGSYGAPINQFSSPSWESKGNEVNNNSLEMPPDLGLDQISPLADNQNSGELEMTQHSGRQYMELDHSKGYHSSVQNVHWNL